MSPTGNRVRGACPGRFVVLVQLGEAELFEFCGERRFGSLLHLCHVVPVLRFVSAELVVVVLSFDIFSQKGTKGKEAYSGAHGRISACIVTQLRNIPCHGGYMCRSTAISSSSNKPIALSGTHMKASVFEVVRLHCALARIMFSRATSQKQKRRSSWLVQLLRGGRFTLSSVSQMFAV